MKICHISQCGPPMLQGLELFTLNLAKYQVKLGHDVFYICSSFNKFKRNEIIEGIKFYRYKELANVSIFKNTLPPSVLAGLSLCKKENIDIIHAHDFLFGGIPAYIVHKLLSIPYIYSEYGLIACRLENCNDLKYRVRNDKIENYDKFKFPLMKPSTYFNIKVVNHICDDANFIITVDHNIRETLKNISGDSKKIKFITTGINTELYTRSEITRMRMRKNFGITDEMCFLFLGKFEKVKGVDMLVNSIPMAIESCPKIKFVLVGYGSLETEMRKRVKELGLQNHVIFTGRITNPLEYFNMADAYIYPSPLHAFSSMSFLGAMSMGLPSIITKSVDSEMHFKDYQHVLYMEKPISKEKIAEKVIELYETENLQKKLRTNSRKIIKEEFNEKIMFDKIMKLYLEVYSLNDI